MTASCLWWVDKPMGLVVSWLHIRIQGGANASPPTQEMNEMKSNSWLGKLFWIRNAFKWPWNSLQNFPHVCWLNVASMVPPFFKPWIHSGGAHFSSWFRSPLQTFICKQLSYTFMSVDSRTLPFTKSWIQSLPPYVCRSTTGMVWYSARAGIFQKV